MMMVLYLRVFNAGDYRRCVNEDEAKKPKHDFFDPNNPRAKAIRCKILYWIKA